MQAFLKAVLIVAIAAAVFLVNGAIFWTSEYRFLLAMALFGAFVGMIALPEFDKRFRKGAERRNIAAGVVVGAGIGILQAMPLIYLAALTLGGALLGYFGLKWVRHLVLL